MSRGTSNPSIRRRRSPSGRKAVAAIALFALLLTALGGCPLAEPPPAAPPTAVEQAPAPSESGVSGSGGAAEAPLEGPLHPPVAPSARQVRDDARLPADLPQTLRRISQGRSFPHRNDGSVFQNRERRLPRKPNGYYREYVHPTPGERGPGAQRVVIGDGGEIYYTPDHYRTFIRVDRGPAPAPKPP